jgi:soluble lytic murein transglycosylase-like protein
MERVKNQELLVSAKDPSEYTKDDINKIADHYARKNKIPEALVRSMISVESSYDPLAVSHKGAMGLMQIMPAVAGEMNVDDPFSPEQNVEAGTGYLKKLINYYNGDYTKALAAYNSGMGTVDRANGVPNINETKRYIDKVVTAYLENSEK